MRRVGDKVDGAIGGIDGEFGDLPGAGRDGLKGRARGGETMEMIEPVAISQDNQRPAVGGKLDLPIGANLEGIMRRIVDGPHPRSHVERVDGMRFDRENAAADEQRISIGRQAITPDCVFGIGTFEPQGLSARDVDETDPAARQQIPRKSAGEPVPSGFAPGIIGNFDFSGVGVIGLDEDNLFAVGRPFEGFDAHKTSAHYKRVSSRGTRYRDCHQ